jgi:ELWxxDGT repeat protein
VDICPGYCDGISVGFDALTGVAGPAGTTWFRGFPKGSDPELEADELWSTDGTPAGTRRIAGHFAGFGFLNGLVYYGSSFGNPTQGHLGSELWATDGTAANTRRIASLRRFEPGSAPSFQPFQDGALILTSNGDGLAALWRSDGTPAGTFPLHDFSRDAQSTYASFLGRLSSAQLVSLYVEPADVYRPAKTEIWRTDGTPGGTRFVAGLPPSSSIGTTIAWRGKLVFTVDSPQGCAFWSSDGTAAGTHPIPIAVSHDCPWLLTALGSGFLYDPVPAAGSTESRLFLSDGTAAGTREIARLGGMIDEQPLQVGGTVFFRVVSASSAELWQTDGTAAGTRATTALIDPSDLQEFAGSLYLTAALSADHDAGRALFRVSLSGGPPIQLAKLFQYSESQVVVQFAREPIILLKSKVYSRTVGV